MKYKQTIIPRFSTTVILPLKPLEVRKLVYRIYRESFSGTKVINESKSILILFTQLGAKKTAFGGGIYPKKAVLISGLDKIVKYGEFTNFGSPKPSDAKYVVGYLNFKCKVIIDNKPELLRYSIQLRNDGKFYYSFDINIYRKK